MRENVSKQRYGDDAITVFCDLYPLCKDGQSLLTNKCISIGSFLWCEAKTQEWRVNRIEKNQTKKTPENKEKIKVIINKTNKRRNFSYQMPFHE